MSAQTAPSAAAAGAPALDPRRWRALAFIALAQLMVVLDATIVNIALPAAQRDLGFSDGNRQWVITAYSLAFGGLLLFGGRIADMVGRKRTFVIGLLGFAGASAIGGASVDTGMLLGARALQGAFGALLAPSALSLLAVTFTEARERAKAFGIFGAIAGGGGALGLVLGGVLTEYLNWRWSLYVNVFFAVVAAFGALRTVREPAGSRNTARLDIPGVVLATLGLVALVYGFTRAETSWTSASTIGLFVASVVLLAAFVVVEARTANPLLPLRVVTDRNRGGVYLSLGTAVIAMFGVSLFLTYYLQVVKGFSPVVTGVAFLPMVGGMITGSTQIGARLMNRIPARWLMGPGFLVAAVGMAIMAGMTPTSSYAGVVLPGLILLGLGMGSAFMPAMSLATHGVRPKDAGVASAMVNTSQQVGGSIGTALLNTVAASSTTGWLVAHHVAVPTAAQANLAAVHGYSVAAWVAAAVLVFSSLAAIIMINAGRPSGSTVAAGGSAEAAAAEDAIPLIAH